MSSKVISKELLSSLLNIEVTEIAHTKDNLIIIIQKILKQRKNLVQ